MRKIIKEGKPKEDAQNDIARKTGSFMYEELKMDGPLSEKDEVKQAEERLGKSAKKQRLKTS